MSDDYWGFGKEFGRDENDGTYRAWRTVQQSSVTNFKLVPADSSDEPEWQVPYLQPITTRYDRKSGLLCVLCHSTGMTIFVEGRGLKELADQIAEKRVKSIHVFDPAKHGKPDNDADVVIKISIEAGFMESIVEK